MSTIWSFLFVFMSFTGICMVCDFCEMWSTLNCTCRTKGAIQIKIIIIILHFSISREHITYWLQHWLTHHVPEEVGHPVNHRADPAHKLQVFGLGHSLLDEVEDEAGGDEGHGENNTDRNHSVYWSVQPEERSNKSNVNDKVNTLHM